MIFLGFFRECWPPQGWGLNKTCPPSVALSTRSRSAQRHLSKSLDNDQSTILGRVTGRLYPSLTPV